VLPPPPLLQQTNIPCRLDSVCRSISSRDKDDYYVMIAAAAIYSRYSAMLSLCTSKKLIKKDIHSIENGEKAEWTLRTNQSEVDYIKSFFLFLRLLFLLLAVRSLCAFPFNWAVIWYWKMFGEKADWLKIDSAVRMEWNEAQTRTIDGSKIRISWRMVIIQSSEREKERERERTKKLLLEVFFNLLYDFYVFVFLFDLLACCCDGKQSIMQTWNEAHLMVGLTIVCVCMWKSANKRNKKAAINWTLSLKYVVVE